MRVRVGQVWVDAVGFEEALDRIEQLVGAGAGGMVFTPNVDHVVVADRDERLRAAYGRVSLSLADGQPIVWASALLGHQVAKVSGSDLFEPLMRRAARRGVRVFLLGASPEVAAEATRRLQGEMGVQVCGADSRQVGIEPLPDEPELARAIRSAQTELLVVCLGAPKAELFLDRVRDQIAPAVGVCLGASLDFYTGRILRAPRWMQRSGLEWLFRLAREPRRLARRYLIDDPAFLGILLRTLRLPRHQRLLDG